MKVWTLSVFSHDIQASLAATTKELVVAKLHEYLEANTIPDSRLKKLTDDFLLATDKTKLYVSNGADNVLITRVEIQEE